MSFAIGENVGPYRITDRLGQGGMATVYRAYHANLDRYVALKVLHAAFKDDPSFLARFRREAQIVARLEHPNIIPIYDYNEHNGEPYLVMKFIEGETLKARLARQPLTLDETLKIMSAVGQALTYAHEQGVLHRDIKPSNILLDTSSQTFIADFGLARMASAGESTMSKDTMLGTPQYMSPEQALGAQELDSGTDIYSLGVVLYELVVGRVPFNADTPYAIVHDHIYTPLPLPSRVNPQVPRAIEQVLLKTLAKDRGDRYPSAVAMVEAFRGAVRESDLKELSAHSYRVPMPAASPSAESATPAFAATPPPVGPSVPAPVTPLAPSAAPTAQLGSTAQKYARQRQRRNLWMLGGCAGLIAIVLTGLFVIVSAANDAAIRGGLAVVRPTSSTRVVTKASGLVSTPTAASGTEPTTGSTSGPTLAATGIAMVQASPTPTAQGTSTPTEEPTLESTVDTTATSPDVLSTPDLSVPLGQLSVAEAQKRVNDNPADPMAHFMLAGALWRDGKPVKAEQEFITGVGLAKDNPALLFDLGQTMAKAGAGPQNEAVALVYAYAYAAGAAADANLRNVTGQYLYTYFRNGHKRDIPLYKKMEEAASDNHSAGLYALLSLAYNVAGQPDGMKNMMDQALKLDGNLPEVHLVRGILLSRGTPLAARRQFEAAMSAPDAPSWIVDEARTLAQQRGS